MSTVEVSQLEEEDEVFVCLVGGRHTHHVSVREPSQHFELVVGVVTGGEGNEFGDVRLLRAAMETLPDLTELTSGGGMERVKDKRE